MPKQKTKIGALIRRTRKAQRMSQMRLAEKIGISYQQIQKYETGASELTLTRLYQIADALSIDPSSLISTGAMGVAESQAPYGEVISRDEIMLLNLFREIKSKKMKESVLNLLKAAAEAEGRKKPKNKKKGETVSPNRLD